MRTLKQAIQLFLLKLAGRKDLIDVIDTQRKLINDLAGMQDIRVASAFVHHEMDAKGEHDVTITFCVPNTEDHNIFMERYSQIVMDESRKYVEEVLKKKYGYTCPETSSFP